MARLLYLFVIIILISCVKNVTEEVDIESDKAYFPLQVGKYKEYTVDSILFRQGRFLDSVRTLVREEIVNITSDTVGDLYIILRSNRRLTTEPWSPAASYTARIADFKVIRNEGNVHFIPMVFPIVLRQQWDGLALVQTDQTYNVLGESIEIYQNWDPFLVEAVDESAKIGSFQFDQVISILQTDEEDILAKRYSLEKYAKGVGLIYKELTVLDCNNTINQCSDNVPWGQRATKGFLLKQFITKYN
ncbi:MAG: hypothetical protein IPG82_14415 [Saprospiraceae bacterium]|jgi:hypothetical protein|nr:hypothetical protein [Saprospiraceae bacterium]MBK6477518.1 hypothetical protein [Saprospiraceae bacterium]MBK6816609.1 hypothetical protein [Saprospiraceae bacterium]MBK8777085.1 hypothetical protein [Saprospiraceae bacterium]MBK9679963.1 hypothetical protein [Saprospiraceae bacterium]